VQATNKLTVQGVTLIARDNSDAHFTVPQAVLNDIVEWEQGDYICLASAFVELALPQAHFADVAERFGAYTGKAPLEYLSYLVADTLLNAEQAVNLLVTPSPRFAKRREQATYLALFAAPVTASVSIIIPSCKPDNVIHALRALQPPEHVEVLVALNNTDFLRAGQLFAQYLSEFSKIRPFSYQFAGGGFSFAEVCNFTAGIATGDALVFLNDDLHISWEALAPIVALQRYRQIGAAAPRLDWYGDVVQNAGIFGGVQRNNMPGLHGRGLPSSAINLMPISCDAVSGACLSIRKALFDELGGFNERDFAVAYNDVDLGYRLVAAGKVCLSVNHIRALHVEGDSRGTGLGNDKPSEEVAIALAYRQLAQSVRAARFNLPLDPETGARLPCNERAPQPLPQKAVLVTHNMKLEGASKVALRVAKQLKAAGVKVYVAALEDGKLKREFAAVAEQVYMADWALLTDNHVYATYEHWLHSVEPDFVIANTVISAAAAYPASDRLELPQINYIHESESINEHLDHFGGYWVDRAAQSLVTSFNIFVSRYTVNAYRHYLKNNNFAILYNPFEADADVPAKRERGEVLEFVAVGSICERKNQMMVFDAMDHLESRDIKARFTLVGARGGDYLSELRDMAGQRRDEYVSLEFVPETNNVAPYYARADVFISFSKMESFPITLLEASYYGLPLISSDVFGAREMIVPGQNGFTFGSQNVDSMNGALDIIAGADVVGMGQNARQLLALWPTQDEYNQRLAGLLKAVLPRLSV
tara:strand:- start:353 stop:2635 length:2283 start_codon:yes stop_codon:yes gene_type:complete